MQTQRANKGENLSMYADFSIPLDLFLSLPSDKLDALVSEIAAEIEQSETRNKRAENVREKLLHSIRIIILNLLYRA